MGQTLFLMAVPARWPGSGKACEEICQCRATCPLNALRLPLACPLAALPPKNTGGSSGGGAAAVGDGLLPFAEGTDGGGSIRIPASWCGVYGYKASFGRVPAVMRPNAFAASSPFLFEGPLTKPKPRWELHLVVMHQWGHRSRSCTMSPIPSTTATRLLSQNIAAPLRSVLSRIRARTVRTLSFM